MVRSYAPQQIFVAGEVVKPGVVAYRKNLTALQAIIEAGGGKPSAAMISVLVLRRAPNSQPQVIRRDLSADQAGSGANDLAPAPADIVVVPKTGIASIGEFMDQLFGMLPLRNSSFGFVYNLTPKTGIVTTP